MATTILVVEDDLEINELIGEYLALESIKYLRATSGSQGLRMAAEEHPDAIILDLMLPDIDGFEVARTLSARRATHDIPIIVLSCMCQQCDKEKGFASGALTYMNKPFLPDDLLAAVRGALAWRGDLKKHVPEGEIALSGSAEAAPAAAVTGAATNGSKKAALKEFACSKAINLMIADLFTQTDLPDAAIVGIREAVEMLREWGVKWNAERVDQPSHPILEYHIKPRAVNGSVPAAPQVEWVLHEDMPGMIADAFFKPAPTGGGFGIGGLIGWGGSQSKAMPVPPVKWMQMLAKTGATSFEKDPVAKTVRFFRMNPGALNAAPAGVVVNAGR
jgi:DNA-binding response OmpR family regulator